MKKTAILASAVAAALMAGTAAADTTAYGKIRISIDLGSETTAGVKDKGVNNNSSRFGFKSSEDLGNGMTAIARIEVGYDADDNTGSAVSNRLGYAGIKGDFGTFQVGNQWTPSYLLVRGVHDPFNSVGGNLVGGNFPAAFRVNDAIAYINKFGDISFAAALVASNDSPTDTEADSLTDHLDVAVSIPAGPVTVGVALGQTNADVSTSEKDTSAIDIGYKGGAFSVNLGLFQTDLDDAAGGDYTVLTAGFDVGGGKVTAQFEQDENDDQTSLGYTHKLSKKSSLFAEFSDGDLATDEMNVGIHVNF